MQDERISEIAVGLRVLSCPLEYSLDHVGEGNKVICGAFTSEIRRHFRNTSVLRPAGPKKCSLFLVTSIKYAINVKSVRTELAGALIGCV